MSESDVRAARPEAVVEGHSRCMNGGDVEGALQLYDADAAFVPERGRWFGGWTASAMPCGASRH
jgi:hypothetical protein